MDSPISTKVICINVLSSGTAFGVRTDTGEQVFIPANVSQSVDLAVGDMDTAMLITNTLHPDKTPWFALRIDRAATTAAIIPAAPTKTLDEKVREFVYASQYVTTAEVAEAMGVETATAGNSLARLFRDGCVAKADVFARPDQERASFCMWAQSTGSFVFEGADDE